MIAQSAARGVRSYQRRFAYFQRIIEGLITDVRDVDKHALPVHLADYFFAEISESVMGRLIRLGVGPLIVVEVRKGHVTDSEIGEDAHNANVIADHMATLHAD